MTTYSPLKINPCIYTGLYFCQEFAEGDRLYGNGDLFVNRRKPHEIAILGSCKRQPESLFPDLPLQCFIKYDPENEITRLLWDVNVIEYWKKHSPEFYEFHDPDFKLQLRLVTERRRENANYYILNWEL